MIQRTLNVKPWHWLPGSRMTFRYHPLPRDNLASLVGTTYGVRYHRTIKYAKLSNLHLRSCDLYRFLIKHIPTDLLVKNRHLMCETQGCPSPLEYGCGGWWRKLSCRSIGHHLSGNIYCPQLIPTGNPACLLSWWRSWDICLDDLPLWRRLEPFTIDRMEKSPIQRLIYTLSHKMWEGPPRISYS